MSTIPSQSDISAIIYADDIAFLASDANIHDLYLKLQSHIKMLVARLGALHLNLNPDKCFVFVFPLNQRITV